ncbi:MAG: gamma-glutamyltransferase, partial [Rhodobiaceae bacterium]|nr:gamma-glutamyltransferase [Rhodobiaceae bacterium]
MGRLSCGVAAGHALTVDAALEALKDGGSAVDAAIAGLWTACVCEPVLASPGGGGFMTVGVGARTDCLDFFVETPNERPSGRIDAHGIEADFGNATQAFTIGAGTSAVPGMVPGLFAAHARYGRLPMKALVAYAASAARDGVRLTAYQAYLISVVSPILTATKGAKALFAGPDGEGTLGEGALFHNSDLADALEEIAGEGEASVHDGEIARLMLRAQEDGGVLTAAALSGYRPVWRDPIAEKIAGHTVYLNPPPSAGGTLIGHMIEGNGGAADGPSMAAAMARTDTAWTGAGRSLDRFLGKDVRRRSAPRGTTHISVVDRDGMAVAITVSNGEGNGIVVPGCGFMINNMLGEDDVNPAGPEDWTPGIRLSSMMAPTLARRADGAITVLGSGGSNRIRSAIYQVLMRHLAGGLPLQAAVEAPRLHVEDGFLDFEEGLPGGERDRLIDRFRDHRTWDEPNMFFGGVHAVECLPDGHVEGAGDPRRAGVFQGLA